MLTTVAFATSSLAVFDAVFGGHAQLLEESLPQGYTLAEHEKIVASVHFGSDTSTGHAYMILRQEDIARAVKLIYDRFGICAPMGEDTVFAEMINIYVANLITALLRGQRDINIEVPDMTPAERIAPDAEETVLLRMQARDALVFTFCYTLSTRKQLS